MVRQLLEAMTWVVLTLCYAGVALGSFAVVSMARTATAQWHLSRSTTFASRLLDVTRGHIRLWLGATDLPPPSECFEGDQQVVAAWRRRAVFGSAASATSVVLAFGLLVLQSMIAYGVFIEGSYEGIP
jgi:hypothetical protein